MNEVGPDFISGYLDAVVYAKGDSGFVPPRLQKGLYCSIRGAVRNSSDPVFTLQGIIPFRELF